jgi:hypothetical protein
MPMSETQKLNVTRIIEGLLIAVLVAVFTGYVVSNRTVGEIGVELRAIQGQLMELKALQRDDKREIKADIEGIRRDIYKPSWQAQQERRQ